MPTLFYYIPTFAMPCNEVFDGAEFYTSQKSPATESLPQPTISTKNEGVVPQAALVITPPV